MPEAFVCYWSAHCRRRRVPTDDFVPCRAVPPRPEGRSRESIRLSVRLVVDECQSLLINVSIRNRVVSRCLPHRNSSLFVIVKHLLLDAAAVREEEGGMFQKFSRA